MLARVWDLQRSFGRTTGLRGMEFALPRGSLKERNIHKRSGRGESTVTDENRVASLKAELRTMREQVRELEAASKAAAAPPLLERLQEEGHERGVDPETHHDAL